MTARRTIVFASSGPAATASSRRIVEEARQHRLESIPGDRCAASVFASAELDGTAFEITLPLAT